MRNDDALSLAASIRKREISAAQAMNASIASADKYAHLGAITSMESGMGLAAAEEFDAAANSADLSEAVFAGVPTLVKDLGGPFRGWPVQASSKALSNSDGEMDSDFADLFRKTGVCIFGMTSVPEFGLSLATEPATGLPCRNPLAPHLTAGGSSGGAAAAVAQGIVAIAHATDAGGSIRVPAACCGLVGLKPSRGAISGGPHFSNHISGLASELAVCRSVRDCAATFNAVSGHSFRSNSGDFEAFDLSGIRIGTIVDTGPDYEICDIRSAVLSKASDCLVAEGAHRIDFDWSDIAPLPEESAKAFATIICANLANMFEEQELDPAKTELITQAALERGFSVSASGLVSAQHSLVSVAHSLSHIFEKVDCILMPMLTSAPKPIGSFPTNHSDLDAHFERMTAFAPTATLANVSGFPAITLPFGEDDEGLPLPVQMIARPGDEKLLLSLASCLEAQQKWVHRFPVAGLPQ